MMMKYGGVNLRVVFGGVKYCISAFGVLINYIQGSPAVTGGELA